MRDTDRDRFIKSGSGGNRDSDIDSDNGVYGDCDWNGDYKGDS